jgi:small-conductance mechanosensitive channel
MFVFGKTPLKPKWFVGAIITTLAHVIWFTAAGAHGGTWAAVIGDIFILLVLTVLLWVRPGLVTAILLGLIQIGSLAYNVYLITQVPFGDPIHKALTAHIVFRTIAIVALVMGYIKYRRESIQSHAESNPLQP